jgi:hypothetical protein
MLFDMDLAPDDGNTIRSVGNVKYNIAGVDEQEFVLYLFSLADGQVRLGRGLFGGKGVPLILEKRPRGFFRKFKG